jgi:perosamine synthetase
LSGITAAQSKVNLFEKKFKKYTQKENVELYSSGSSALYELLLGLNIQPNDRVLLPSYICSSVEKAILKCHAIPIYYDNEQESWISSFEQISKKVTKNTKAIIVNHTFGIRYSFEEIRKIANLNISIIEDCAHFISNKKEDIEISNLFTASFYSFNATKLLATGEGGAVCTNDRDLAQEMLKYKLDRGVSDLNAALGLSQLEQLDIFLEKRERIANYYFENLGDVVRYFKHRSSIYFRFPVFVKNNELFLRSKKVAFRKGVDELLHSSAQETLLNVEKVFQHTISIPIYPNLTKKQQAVVVNEFKRLNDEN